MDQAGYGGHGGTVAADTAGAAGAAGTTGPTGAAGAAGAKGRAEAAGDADQGRHRRTPRAAAAGALSKVPVQITAWFWLTKVLTTGMGETTSDYLGRVNPAAAGAIGLIGLVLSLRAQLRAPRYSPWTYWSAVVMVSVFGTMAADVVHVAAGIPYAVSAAAFSVLLAAILIAWYRSEGTLSIHSIGTRRRERFYWATVLTTFALGTATGDLTAGSLHWGYFSSGVLFAAAIAVPALARAAGLNAVAAFWWAYVLTRPLGASFADWAGANTAHGGLGWGTGPVSLALAALIVLAVSRLAAGHRGAAAAA